MNRHYKERHRYPWEDIQDVLSGKKLQDALCTENVSKNMQ